MGKSTSKTDGESVYLPLFIATVSISETTFSSFGIFCDRLCIMSEMRNKIFSRYKVKNSGLCLLTLRLNWLIFKLSQHWGFVVQIELWFQESHRKATCKCTKTLTQRRSVSKQQLHHDQNSIVRSEENCLLIQLVFNLNSRFDHISQIGEWVEAVEDFVTGHLDLIN